MSEIIYVRHGRTAWNAMRKFQGTADIPLDDVGREQARATGERLHDVKFDIAIASDLSRALETARIILTGRSVTLEREPKLRERDFGAWEGLTWDEIVERRPEFGAAENVTWRHFQPEGGETFDALLARVGAVHDALAKRLKPEQRALVVAHAGVLHAVFAHILGPDGAFGALIAPASITRIAVVDGRSEITERAV